MKQRGILTLLILAVLAVSGYFAFIFYSQKLPESITTPLPVPPLDASGSPNPNPSLIIGWKTYTNSTYGLEMKYPKEFTYKSIGSNQDEIASTRSAVIARSRPEILDRIVFTDSNKNQFTLNFYAPSSDSNSNTKVGNLFEYSGFCGTQFAERTLASTVHQVNNLSYKVVSQIDPNGKSLTDFCFFNTGGNLIVLRNELGSTEIAMKLILSTVRLLD